MGVVRDKGKEIPSGETEAKDQWVEVGGLTNSI